MPVPFDFSVRDFVVNLEIAHRIIKALRELQGASADYTYSLTEIKKYKAVLQLLQRLDTTSDSARIWTRYMAISRSKRFVKFWKLADDMESIPGCRSRIKKYMTQPFRQVEWGLRFKTEMETLRAMLNPPMTEIDCLLQKMNL
jgi:hypothetical protein